MQRLKVISILMATAALVSLVWLHVPGVNGPFYWKWHWRRLEIAPLVLAMGLGAIPFFAAQWVFERWRNVWISLGLLFVAMIVLQLTAIAAQPPGGLARARLLIEDPQATSYFTDAQVPLANHLRFRDWIGDYPRLLPRLHLHSQFKPPGAILFHYFFLRWFEDVDAAATADAIAIAVLTAAAAPMVYLLMRALEVQVTGAFGAASYLALCPSMLLMFPQLDTVYVAWTCLLVMAWVLALRNRSTVWAGIFGLALGVGTFTSYIFTGIGVFLAVYTLLLVTDEPRKNGIWALVCGAVAGAALVVFYLALYLAWGFDPIATSAVIRELQMSILVWMGRPWPYHLAFDLLDFLLAGGWICGLLILFFAMGRREKSLARRAAWVALLQVLMLWLTGIFPGETARLWLPFLPFLILPVGIELARWKARYRTVVYACLLLITCSVCRNMIFVYAGRDIDGLRPFYLPFQTESQRARMQSINPDPP